MSFTMFLLICLALLIGTGVGYRKGSKKALKIQKTLEMPVDRKPITSKRHNLKGVYLDRHIVLKGHKQGQDFHGWHYMCSCNTVAPATDNPGGIGSGSEPGAVLAWRKHAEMHAELVDAGDDELAEVKAEFEKYKKECFCHDLGRN